MHRLSTWLCGFAVAGLIALAFPAAGASTDIFPGAFDPSFGDGGIAGIPAAEPSYGATVLEPDGKIIVGGSSVDSLGIRVFTVWRLAADGNLDSTFGTGGAVTAYSLGGVEALALQPDGKIVTAAINGMARLNPDGSFDSTFGTGGVLAPPASKPVNLLALQPDGKIVTAGSDFIARLNADGSVDSSFASGGVQSTPPGVAAVALQPDGKIIAAGGSYHTDFGPFFVLRLNAGGSLDATFGSNGVVTRQLGAGAYPYSWAAAVLVQADGKIVAAGGCTDSTGHYQVAVARLDSNGSFDSSFGNAGVVIAQLSPPPVPDSSIQGLALQPNGKILAAGHMSDGYENNSLVMRIQADGSLDGSFGTRGVASSHWGKGFSFHALALQPDGKVIAAGSGIVYGIEAGNFGLVTRLIVDLPPTAAFISSPDPATTGRRIAFSSVGSGDADGTVTAYAWRFGDGATATASEPTHTYTRPGNYTVTLTVTDDYGLTNSVSHTIKVVRPPAPRLTLLRLRPHTFEAAAHGASIARQAGTTVSYRDSLAAKTRFTLNRISAGKVRGPVRGSFAHQDRKGVNSFHFTGRVGSQRLRPGSYRLNATPTANGKTGTTIHTTFRITR